MRRSLFSRRLIALGAAYLVALQALILPLSMPVSASPAASLCVSAQDGGGAAGAPAGQDHACPCAAGCGMQCHAPALGAGVAGSLPAPQFVLAAMLVPGSLPAQAPSARRGAQLPRGPPVA